MEVNRLKYYYLIFVMSILSCSEDGLTDLSSLDSILDGEEVVIDNVIACAANANIEGSVNVFFYPRDGATNFQYFETKTANVDKNDFKNYTVKSP